MRPTLLPVLIALLLVPLASARPDLPDLSGGQKQVGPCLVGWSWYWPGETVGVRCTAAGTTVAASYGTCALGNYVYVQVGRGYVYVPCDGPWQGESLLS